ncbi:MAG: alpha/beta hydrolase [Gemmatimonadaceae bacterium]|nr:alpha/beta hydrolase [Gemmatimonadaceae bacterium]
MTAASPPRRIGDWKIISAAVVATVALLLILGRAVAYRAIEHQGLITPPNGPETPLTFGAPFTSLSLTSGDRRLDAVAVDAAQDSAPVIVVFHGTNEAVSYWADVQALWRSQGVASLVFDYSGFGRSTGRPSAVHCDEDARVAYAAARAHFGAHRRYIVIGYSLGTGILLAAAHAFQPAPAGLAVVSGYSSAKEAAVAFLGIPRFVSMALPDLWNNVQSVRALTLPVLVLHSRDDKTFPMWMAEAVQRSAGGPSRLVQLSGFEHADGHLRPTVEYWRPVLDFARSGALPAAQN